MRKRIFIERYDQMLAYGVTDWLFAGEGLSARKDYRSAERTFLLDGNGPGND